jgi:hypothetical protein
MRKSNKHFKSHLTYNIWNFNGCGFQNSQIQENPFLFVFVLFCELELRASSCLYSTTWTMSPVLFGPNVFRWNFFLGGVYDHDLPTLTFWVSGIIGMRYHSHLIFEARSFWFFACADLEMWPFFLYILSC